MEGWHYIYEPFDSAKVENGIVNVDMYEQYLKQSFWPSQLELIVLEPLNEAIRESGKKEHHFKNFTVNVSLGGRTPTSWSNVYEKFKTFLEIRSDDSRAADILGLDYREGIGYCISTENLLKEIEDRIEEFTSRSSYLQVNWPRKKKNELPLRDILLPDIDYSKISEEVALAAFNARRFKSSLEKEIVEEYIRTNEIWMKQQTGYDREKIPPKGKSPVKRVRHVGDLRYIVINLVREDKPDYKTVIQTILADLSAIKQGARGELWESYRPTEDGFVNIKKLIDRLDNLYNKNINPDVRYEISP